MMKQKILNNLQLWPIVVDPDLHNYVKDKLNKSRFSDCDTANEFYLLLLFMEIRKGYIETFSKLQKREYREAWDDLVRIENSIINISKNYEIPDFFRIKHILETIQKIQKFYPYKLFTSKEMIIKEMKCSICGKVINPIKPCAHKAGVIYCGEMCIYTITKAELIAFALVEDPFDKFTVLKPEGLNHNYQKLDFLMDGLSNPFEEWRYIETKRLKPEYRMLTMKRSCPCGSKKKFKHCCYKKEENWMPHVEVTIKNPKKKVGKDIIIYDGPWDL